MGASVLYTVHAAAEAFEDEPQGNRADDAIAELLLDFERQRGAVHLPARRRRRASASRENSTSTTAPMALNDLALGS